MAKSDGGPAFPVQVTVGSDGKENGLQFGNRDYWATGMSLRDWFAGMALQGILRADDGSEGEPVMEFRNAPVYAECAYKLADAMLKEREK